MPKRETSIRLRLSASPEGTGTKGRPNVKDSPIHVVLLAYGQGLGFAANMRERDPVRFADFELTAGDRRTLDEIMAARGWVRVSDWHTVRRDDRAATAHVMPAKLHILTRHAGPVAAYLDELLGGPEYNASVYRRHVELDGAHAVAMDEWLEVFGYEFANVFESVEDAHASGELELLDGRGQLQPRRYLLAVTFADLVAALERNFGGRS